MPANNDALAALVGSLGRSTGEGEALGKQIGRLYTDHGLPLDMALDKLDAKWPGITKDQKVLVLYGACQWFIEHKRNSGASEKAIERQRNLNAKIIADYIKTGETQVY